MELADQDRIGAALARAKVLLNHVPVYSHVSAVYALDLNSIVEEVSDLLGRSSSSFLYPEASFRGSLDKQCASDLVKSKLDQLISRLSYLTKFYTSHPAAGDLLNSIKDHELKSRCVDLLSASGNYDRAVREATVVLEERIRKRAGEPVDHSGKPLIGMNLVSKAINSEISRTIIKLSDVASEHEGFALICRGLTLSFRNATHHKLSEDYSREDALKVCAFIDNILATLETAVIHSPT